MVGTTLRRRYKIIQQLGSGAFGDTYLAKDEDLPGEPLRVVKHLRPKNPNPAVLPLARRLFKTEAEVLYRLKHEQIPELFAHFEENGEFYLVQAYIDGQDLSKAELTPGKQLSEAEVIKLLQGILEVLAFVHQQNTIHRDIKPQNLIKRRQDGKLFLIDFGAVKEIHTLMINTQGHTVAIGTRGYMPSEQFNGQPQLCSDVYAVGMIGIQALTGIQPDQLPKDPTLEVIWRNQAQVSPKIADILDKMVRYHFSDRYPSAVEALQALLGLTTPSSPTDSLPLSPSKPRGHKIALFMGLFGGLVAVVVGVIKLIPQPKPTEIAFSTYENPNYGIKIKYPQDWDKQENPNIITKEVVEFISPKENETDTFREKLIITFEDLSSPLSLEEYTNLSKQEISQQNRNAKIANEGEFTLAARNAYQVVYTYSDGKYNFKNMEVWTLKNSKAYSITYLAESNKYDSFLNTAKTMIKSLQVETRE